MRPAIILCFALVCLACVYDKENKCGQGQILENGFCVCAPNHGYKGQDLCIPCGLNEHISNGQCSCKSGYSRPVGVTTCEPAMGLGEACSDDAPCVHQPFTFCKSAAGLGGYCTTQGCGPQAPCAGGYFCKKDDSKDYCARPPVGQGKSCSTGAECGGTEATFCEASQLKMCLVEGCDVGAKDCTPGFTCCDLSRLGLMKTLCLPAPACP